ncbi:MAG TPA: hypothetical protein VEJ63_19195 [Planctomycetota bacterium]|nr:hypothetical protein [Planctomycetota bacterium]
MIFSRILNLCALALLCASVAFAAERKEVRVLYDFEDGADLEQIKQNAESATFDVVQDNGVTRGKNCCRVVFAKGGGYGVFYIHPSKTKNWSNFDYIAFDIFQEREDKMNMCFELWDAATKGYPTRCTFESNTVRQGKNTVVVQINRAKRNGKEGRTWEECLPADKINMEGLTKVKVFLECPKDRDLVWWIDNVRLLQEDALGGKMTVALPAGAKAFKLGPPGVSLAGFTQVPPGTPVEGAAITGAVENVGKAWPDPLTGAGVLDKNGGQFTFEAKLPDGEYWLWLSAGLAINAEAANQHFLLKVGDETIVDDKAGAEQIKSEKYLFRFMKTQYSERENALWLDYIDKMYASYEKKVKVTGGKLTITAANHWLSSVIVLPADQEAAFKKLTADIKTERMKTFHATVNLDPQKKPAKKETDGPFVAFIPDEKTHFRPDTAPNDAERARKEYDLAAAAGQNVFVRLGLTAFDNVGKAKFELSSLKGPGEIPAGAARLYFMDYRVRGDSIQEAGLIPSNELNAEKGTSWCFYAWLKVPNDAKPGDYSGTATLTAGGKPTVFPIKLKVYPIKLEDKLPYSFGMYYSPPADKKAHAEQLRFKRDIGFTATCLPAPAVTGVQGNSVTLSFNADVFKAAKEAGFGVHPQQQQMTTTLGGARQIGRRFLGLGRKIDDEPGIEISNPQLKPLFIDYCRQFVEFVKQQDIPVAYEIIDEPREVPNPWNRNLVHTNLYADWQKEGGITTGFVTPMGDTQSGKDYTSLVDHASIISTHAGKGSEKLMTKTIEVKKPLWLYNTGMDRLSWGFYNWRVNSVGRWEWHFCFHEPGSNYGYYNATEWYNPFTTSDAFSPNAPASYPGSMLFKTAYFSAAEGITDTAYIVTLEKAIAAAEGNAAKADAVAKAKEFLAALKKTIPFLPGVKGIASEADGALVGQGLDTPAAAMCETWRRKLAEFIIALK